MQLKINDLTFGYNKKEEKIIENFNLEVQKGEVVALVGVSGSGKSTVLRLTAGLEIPDSGQIIIAGQSVADEHKFIAAEKREVGMVFQDYALFPHLSVEKNIAFGIDHLSKSKRKTRVKELLKLVNLEGFEKRYPHQLSGGQQQRVALARALAPGPEILLLDEPFSSLDSELRTQLASEVRDLLKADGVTAILVTHDQHEAFAMADVVSLLHDGRIDQTDAPYNLYHRPANAFVAEFIGGGSLIDVTVNADGELNDSLGVLDMESRSFAPEQRLRLLIRPDDIEYDESSTIELRVVDRAFRGANFLYELLLPDGQHVPCLAPSHIAANRGSLLPVRFNLQHVVIFNGEHQVFT